MASAAGLFVCIVDESKLVERLGGPAGGRGEEQGGRAGDGPAGVARVSVPLAVLPMAATFVAERVRALRGSSILRPGYRSDDGMAILDVTGLDLSDPERLEAELDTIPGVLASGIFARRAADVVLAGANDGVRTIGGRVRRLKPA